MIVGRLQTTLGLELFSKARVRISSLLPQCKRFLLSMTITGLRFLQAVASRQGAGRLQSCWPGRPLHSQMRPRASDSSGGNAPSSNGTRENGNGEPHDVLFMQESHTALQF